MIERYARAEMTKVWSEETKLSFWLEIELLAVEAWAKIGAVPEQEAKRCRQRGYFDGKKIAEIEKEVRHDVIAFLTSVGEAIGPAARHLHKGMTSSDVIDTCLASQTKLASEILFKDLDALLHVLKRRAHEFKDTVCMGRSHGIHAEPTTFGLVLALYYEEFSRARKRLTEAAQQMAVGKISGAVGTFANVDPRVEKYVCEKLGLGFAKISTQILQRDRHAHYLTALALIAASIEKLALEIRHLQRTEVGEVEEFFSPGQKGSSAMPHKRNPILSENLCGLARLMRGYAWTALENVPLWHERDISHSSAERVIFPDATITLDFMLARLTSVIDKLVVFPENMLKNLALGKGLHNSQRVLLALTEKGLTREEAYQLVQDHAMKAWHEGKDFLAELKTDKLIAQNLSAAELEKLFDLSYHTKYVDTIFKRVFGEEK